MKATYKIMEGPHGGYSIVRVSGTLITWVQTNIKTREKAEKAKEIWEEREAKRNEAHD